MHFKLVQAVGVYGRQTWWVPTKQSGHPALSIRTLRFTEKLLSGGGFFLCLSRDEHIFCLLNGQMKGRNLGTI